jgi:short subunit dehydrogenase-like uncharacterized protein
VTQTAPIAVYGATGYTGRLVTAEALRRGLDVILSGRSAEKLRELSAAHGGVPWKAAGLDDRHALRHAFGDAAAVINCAGPFTRYGEAVLRAAIETGTHYVDTTGEQGWMRRVFGEFDAPARAAEVSAVPAVGFDYLPGDLLCHLVAKPLEPVAELVLAYAPVDFEPTHGTLRSAFDSIRDDDVVYRGGAWRPAPRRLPRASFAFPPPLGREAMTRYPCGEVVTVPRHVDVDDVTALITAKTFVPHPALAPVLGPMLAGVSLALRSPAGAVLDGLVDRLPEGPDPESRAAVRFTIAATARGRDGSERRGVLHGSDIYGVTAVIAVHAASLQASAGFDRAGALGPAAAFDASEFLGFLGDHGVAYEIDGVAGDSAAQGSSTASPSSL